MNKRLQNNLSKGEILSTLLSGMKASHKKVNVKCAFLNKVSFIYVVWNFATGKCRRTFRHRHVVQTVHVSNTLSFFFFFVLLIV